jgi:hypothetical protein
MPPWWANSISSDQARALPTGSARNMRAIPAFWFHVLQIGRRSEYVFFRRPWSCSLLNLSTVDHPSLRSIDVAFGEPLALPKQQFIFEPSLCAAAIAQFYRAREFSALYQFRNLRPLKPGVRWQVTFSYKPIRADVGHEALHLAGAPSTFDGLHSFPVLRLERFVAIAFCHFSRFVMFTSAFRMLLRSHVPKSFFLHAG